jgi:hypothetical protein
MPGLAPVILRETDTETGRGIPAPSAINSARAIAEPLGPGEAKGGGARDYHLYGGSSMTIGKSSCGLRQGATTMKDTRRQFKMAALPVVLGALGLLPWRLRVGDTD